MGYISIYSNKDFSSLKNDLFDFQLAQLSNDLEVLMRFSAKQFALAALSVNYNYYIEIVKTVCHLIFNG